MPKPNQAAAAPEREISVDLNAADPSKAVSRRAAPSDIAAGVKDDKDGDDKPRTKYEKELFKRMGRMERNLERQFDQRMAAREADHQRELSEMRTRMEKLSVDRGGGDDKADQAHEAAITALKAKLEAAYEKGDSRASADITLEISKLDAQYWAKKAAAAGATTRETAGENKDKGAGQQQATPQNKGPTVAGGRFIRANDEWWDDPDHDVEKQAAQTIYARLVNQDGYDPKADSTYTEVAKQLKAKFPSLDVHPGKKGPGDEEDDDEDVGERGRDRDDRGQQRQRRAPSANLQDRGEGGQQNRGSRRTLTAQDIQTMKDCRLDPDNDRDVVQFLKEAVALESAQV